MGEDLVQYAVEGPSARITLNRPEKLNALSYALVDELRRALVRAGADDASRWWS